MVQVQDMLDALERMEQAERRAYDAEARAVSESHRRKLEAAAATLVSKLGVIEDARRSASAGQVPELLRSFWPAVRDEEPIGFVRMTDDREAEFRQGHPGNFPREDGWEPVYRARKLEQQTVGVRR